jgi:hypothetical protein
VEKHALQTAVNNFYTFNGKNFILANLESGKIGHSKGRQVFK